jgi:hypothetical protein
MGLGRFKFMVRYAVVPIKIECFGAGLIEVVHGYVQLPHRP